MEATTLNEAQMSILRLLGSMKTVEEVKELRQVICDYYARRVDEEMDLLWEAGPRMLFYAPKDTVVHIWHSIK